MGAGVAAMIAGICRIGGIALGPMQRRQAVSVLTRAPIRPGPGKGPGGAVAYDHERQEGGEDTSEHGLVVSLPPVSSGRICPNAMDIGMHAATGGRLPSTHWCPTGGWGLPLLGDVRGQAAHRPGQGCGGGRAAPAAKLRDLSLLWRWQRQRQARRLALRPCHLLGTTKHAKNAKRLNNTQEHLLFFRDFRVFRSFLSSARLFRFFLNRSLVHSAAALHGRLPSRPDCSQACSLPQLWAGGRGRLDGAQSASSPCMRLRIPLLLRSGTKGTNTTRPPQPLTSTAPTTSSSR